MKTIAVLAISVCCVVVVVEGFKDLNDGARILGPSIEKSKLSSYSIPLRTNQVPVGERIAGVLSAFNDDEYTLIAKMKTMETPPSPGAVDYYADSKHVGTRFTQQPPHSKRSRRSLKFEDTKNSGAPSDRSPSSSDLSLTPTKGDNNKDGGNKRIFPELFGLQSGPGYYGHHYPPPHHGGGGHHYPNYYPNQGSYYPNYGNGGGYYNNGGGHHYPPHGGGGGYPYPGMGIGGGGSSSSASAAAASASSGGGYRPSGLYGGNGYYGGGYGNGYYPSGGVAPILGMGHGGGYPPPHHPGGGFLGGFFRDEDGKGGGSGSSIKVEESGNGKASASVSFGDAK